jgi:hypothetical protein
MKKRHVTELTGEELQAAFRAAVHESWDLAAKSGQTVYGTMRVFPSVKPEDATRRPDGACAPVNRTTPKRTTTRKTIAA